jgi:hypothetical protein
LFGVKRLGHDTLGGTLFDVFTVGFKHSITLISGPKWVSGTLIQQLPETRTTKLFEFLGQGFGNSLQKLFSKFYACRTADEC